MHHCQHLPFHRRKGAGGFHLDQILVKGGQNAGKREHEVRQGGSHVPDEPGRGRMHGLGNELFLEEFSVVRNVGGIFRNAGPGKIPFYFIEVALDGNNMFLQKAGQII